MSDDWIKVRTVLPSDGRLRIVSRTCHVSTVTAFGALVTLWCLADSHAAANGELVGYTKADIDTLITVPGFCDALPADWIDTSGDFVKLPNYQEHNGTSGKSRAQAAKRQRKHREDANPSRSERDTSVTREEKRREEKKEQEKPTPAKPRKPKAQEQTLTDWLTALPADQDALPADDPLVEWAVSTGIPPHWLAYAWAAFEDKYTDDPKTYTDWRAVFRKAVKGDWLKVWRMTPTGPLLTTVGEQWRNAA